MRASHREAATILSAALSLAVSLLCFAADSQASAPPAPAPAATAPAPPPPAAPAAAPQEFEPLDLPDWVILEDATRAAAQPWILVIDDPQCPYCMQLHLAIEKAREKDDPELTRAVIARLPFPLAFHDQAAWVVMDALCLEATRSGRAWNASAYLDWLMVEPWKTEPEWKSVTVEDLVRDGGLFDTKYDAHKVTSSRRRDYQTEMARAEANACLEDKAPSCRADAECEKLCAAARECRAACSAKPAASPDPPPAKPAPSVQQECVSNCAAKFTGARYRQYSKAHSACLLAEGPTSAHGRAAAGYAWAVDHKVPGTPTIYAGHPTIGFRLLGDSDSMVEFLANLRSALAASRARLAAAPRAAQR